MACASCGRQRMAVKDNLKAGNITAAAKAAAVGVGMMAGMLPKEARPTSHLTPTVTRASANISTSNAERLARNANLRKGK